MELKNLCKNIVKFLHEIDQSETMLVGIKKTREIFYLGFRHGWLLLSTKHKISEGKTNQFEELPALELFLKKFPFKAL